MLEKITCNTVGHIRNGVSYQSYKRLFNNMDLTTLGQLKEIGIALVVVVGCWWLLRDVMKSIKETTQKTIEANKDVFDKLMERMHEQESNYRSYVESNNHQKTEMMEEAVRVMADVGNSIEQHNKILEKLVDKLEK